MPNLVTVYPHAELVGIRKVKKNAKTYYMGSVMLGNVTVGIDSLTGHLLDEWSETREPSREVLDHLTEIVYLDSFGFGEVTVWDADTDDEIAEYDETDEIVMFHPVTGNEYKAAWVVGNEFYVSKVS